MRGRLRSGRRASHRERRLEVLPAVLGQRTSYFVGTIVIVLRGGRTYFRFWRGGSLMSVCGTCLYGMSDRKWLMRFRWADRLLSVSTTYHGASLMSQTLNILS